MVRILIHGRSGTMGRVLADMAQASPDIDIAAGVDPAAQAAEFSFPVFTALADCDKAADVIIDFSAPEALESILEGALQMNTALIIATTGHTDDDKTLIRFYTQVRPWGVWQPIYEKAVVDNPGLKKNTQAARDMFNVGVGIIWQTSLRLVPVFLIVFELTSMWIAAGLVIVTSFILKKNWYDKLENA